MKCWIVQYEYDWRTLKRSAHIARSRKHSNRLLDLHRNAKVNIALQTESGILYLFITTGHLLIVDSKNEKIITAYSPKMSVAFCKKIKRGDLEIVGFRDEIICPSSQNDTIFNGKQGENMENKIARFGKVSFEQYAKAVTDDNVKELYDSIKCPQRGTPESAGYDFFSPQKITLRAQETITIPTGICANIQPGWFLMMLPRSGHGFKYRIQLDNTAGIIDADYYFADNEGHIFVKLTNDSKTEKTLEIMPGDGFCQGIFIPHGITTDDSPKLDKRTGGGGSTDKDSKGIF